jgi:hypothetical protein
MRRMLVLVAALAGVAFASVAAWGHVLVAPTALSIQLRGGPIEAGDTAVITGRLTGRPACRSGQSVALVRVGTGVVATTTTTTSGAYRFEFVATEDVVLRTRFSGSSSAVHPHSHVCSGSTSRSLQVKVRGAEGGPDVLGEGGTRAGAEDVTGGGGTALSGSDVSLFAALGASLLVVGVAAFISSRRRFSHPEETLGGR